MCFNIITYEYQKCSNIYIYDINKKESFLLKNGNEHFIIDYISHSVVNKTTDISDTSDHTHHTNPQVQSVMSDKSVIF